MVGFRAPLDVDGMTSRVEEVLERTLRRSRAPAHMENLNAPLKPSTAEYARL
jgi:hypothetical protein